MWERSGVLKTYWMPCISGWVQLLLTPQILWQWPLTLSSLRRSWNFWSNFWPLNSKPIYDPHPQAAECVEKERKERMRKEGKEMAEVLHMVTSDILTECPKAAERQVNGGPVGGPRVLTDRWRGMSPVQLSAIRRQREEQRLEGKVMITSWTTLILVQIFCKPSIDTNTYFKVKSVQNLHST